MNLYLNYYIFLIKIVYKDSSLCPKHKLFLNYFNLEIVKQQSTYYIAR